MASGKKHQTVKKYLAGYSEYEVSLLSNIPSKYSHTVVIPLYDESFDVVYQLLSTQFSFNNSNNDHSILFVLVINCPQDGDLEAEARTIDLLRTLRACLQSVFDLEHLTYGDIEPGRGAIIVDRCSEGRRVPKKQGVGLARKIGADLACHLITAETIKSRWIHLTDADVILPAGYFDCASNESTYRRVSDEPVALIYPFKHVPEEGYEIASELYDWSLRYYVECLKWAGSGYAYHTIGSLIAVDYEAYAKVRGFPKRSGGEDFYLLNKLAKVGVISSLEEPVVKISARPSQRVPFGTGPAICKIIQNKHAVATHVFYHPGIFHQLKIVYRIINQSWNARENKTLISMADILLTLEIENVTSTLVEALETLGFVGAWKHAVRQSGTEKQFIKQINVWFDAFKTLKFVHYMRDHGYASLVLEDIVNETQVLSEELRDSAVSLLTMSCKDTLSSN